MGVIRSIITSFNGGELSPRMMGRSDTAIYQIGLETCENFVPTVEGPIVKRPGFEYICPADAAATWLSTFRFNLTQDYVIEWSNLKARFFTNGGRIETSPGVAYEVTTPYPASAAPSLSLQQSFDRLYIAHRSYPLAALTRTGASTFVHSALTLKNGPFRDQNTNEGIFLTVNGVALGATITITANSPIFEASHIGAPFRIEASDFSDIQSWEVARKNVTVGTKMRSDGKAYIAETNGTTGSVQPTHTSGAEWDGSNRVDINDVGPYGVAWRYVHDRYGIVTITGIGGGGTTATATVTRRLPDSLTSVPTWRWAHGAFSSKYGWPNLVSIWGGRMILIKDFDVIGSVVGDYGGGQVNFATTTSSGATAPDLAFRRTIATEDPALWVAGDRKLIIGTASREIAVGAINSAVAVSGDNIAAEPQSFYGSVGVYPCQIASSTIFVQRGGRKLREVGYDFAKDRYTANNITVWSRHVTKSGIRQMAFQKEPEELLFCVRGDGQMAVHPHAPEQDIKGFARIIPGGGGKILSAVCITDQDGLNDELWALIERAGVKSIERMAPWRDDGDPIEDAFFVDAGLTVMASAGQTHFTGAVHLAGKAVAVLAAGAVIDDITVDGSGAFDLPASAVPDAPFRVTVGLPFTARCITLRPELKLNGQTSVGLKHRLVRIGVRVLETVGIRVGGAGGKLDNLIDRSAAADMDEPVAPYTGDSSRAVSANWTRNGQAEFVSDVPLPATIIAAMPRIDVGDDT
ncbi:hypothetical protein FIM10_01820 [Sphingomonadales bacterium 56]|uniref:hypothetical protein n=1 Tax=unclassified Sphingobium TaxID=2611147 RepID=UPI00191870F3|nr:MULTISPECIES: hypothetical protein [unclassified Sphingobium]MBY2927421.1 hypothetical protein [Sphingomonadales bacterium 56]MBY2957489.1 hypothetical protein [Sphingomonadales bacterium 58]MBY2957532.1 hypothetical protein [Sphingomonadales bacterium 58]CAD7335157.1 hypothetical protein SPHS8_00366 [Sphingobium sp. S8]CAD7335176.1 hypothetical protein SPHS6_00366 [Sphingobium sp. S6]